MQTTKKQNKKLPVKKQRKFDFHRLPSIQAVYFPSVQALIIIVGESI